MTNQFIGYVVGETPRAILFIDHFWFEADWMPKSQITTTRHYNSTEVVIEASAWICKQKGIREFNEREEA